MNEEISSCILTVRCKYRHALVGETDHFRCLAFSTSPYVEGLRKEFGTNTLKGNTATHGLQHLRHERTKEVVCSWTKLQLTRLFLDMRTFDNDWIVTCEQMRNCLANRASSHLQDYVLHPKRRQQRFNDYHAPLLQSRPTRYSIRPLSLAGHSALMDQIRRPGNIGVRGQPLLCMY